MSAALMYAAVTGRFLRLGCAALRTNIGGGYSILVDENTPAAVKIPVRVAESGFSRESAMLISPNRCT